MIIGAHVSASGGIGKSIQRGTDIGAEAIQIFTNNPRSWSQSTGSPIKPEELAAYLDARRALPAIKMVFTHVTYLVNIASNDDAIYKKSKISLAANLAAALSIGATGAILHPGSHKGSGFESCKQRIVDGIAWAFDQAFNDHVSQNIRLPPNTHRPGSSEEERMISDTTAVTANTLSTTGTPGTPGTTEMGTTADDQPLLLLENTAGAGGTVGRSFDELASLIEALDSVGMANQIGICLDTQHMWASGMRYTTIEDADRLIDDFNKLIGIGRLRCIHLNDSKVPYGSQRDRHENIGEGTIGIDGLAALIGHPSLSGLPAILEVPGNGHGPEANQVIVARETLRIGKNARKSAAHAHTSN